MRRGKNSCGSSFSEAQKCFSFLFFSFFLASKLSFRSRASHFLSLKRASDATGEKRRTNDTFHRGQRHEEQQQQDEQQQQQQQREEQQQLLPVSRDRSVMHFRPETREWRRENVPRSSEERGGGDLAAASSSSSSSVSEERKGREQNVYPRFVECKNRIMVDKRGQAWVGMSKKQCIIFPTMCPSQKESVTLLFYY